MNSAKARLKLAKMSMALAMFNIVLVSTGCQEDSNHSKAASTYTSQDSGHRLDTNAVSPVQKTSLDDVSAAQRTPRIDVSPVQRTPHVDVSPVQRTPRVDVSPVQKTRRDEVQPEPFSRPTLSWNAPTTREDGSRLYVDEIMEYRIYYSLRHETVVKTFTLTDNARTRFTLNRFAPGAYAFSVTAVDVDGRESRRSEEVTVNLI